MKLSLLSKIFSLTFGCLIIVMVTNGANRYSVTNNGSWNSTGTWSATSGGTSGASVPVAGDAVFIERGKNVIVTSDAACASITFTGNNATSLTISGTNTLTVSGTITIPDVKSTNIIDVGSGTLNAGSIAFTGGGSNNPASQIKISTGTVLVTGNVSGISTSNSIVFTGAGTLILGGTFFTSLTGTLTQFSGSTVVYNGNTNQTIGDFTYNNLTLSGSGVKTIPTSNLQINGILSIEGTATTSAAPKYGSSATLQYNTSSPYIPGPEWIASFAGSVIVKNSAITLNSNKSHFTSASLTVNPGASLSVLSDTLTISGNFTNSGTVNGGSGLIQIGGTVSGVAGSFISGTGTVEYNGGSNQTAAAFTYYNLELSGGNIKDISSVISISNNLWIQPGTKASIGSSINIQTLSLTLNTTNQLDGTYGSSTSPATNKTDTYFNNTAATKGQVTVSNPPFNITAGGGGTVCQGSSVTLTSAASYGLVSQSWTGPNGFSSSLQNVQLNNVTPAMSGDYTVTGNCDIATGTNLVFNGDFEKGDIGFSSGYWNGRNPNMRNYQYAVIANPQDIKPQSGFSNCPNHTPTGRLQLVVQGGNVKTEIVWAETINLKKNTNYQFSYWLQSVVGTYPAQIELHINGQVVNTSPVAPTNTCSWIYVSYVFNSGPNASVPIEMYNLTQSSSGNGFAIDDISCKELIKSASATVSLTVKPTSVGGNVSGSTAICSGSPLTTGLTLVGYTGDILKWQKSNNTAFSSPTDINLQNPTLTAANIGTPTETTYFRAVVQSGPCSLAYSTMATIKVDKTPTATISYAGSPYCNFINTSQIPTFSGTGDGGTYSSTTGLTIDPVTGGITPNTSTPGTYTVSYTVTNSCGTLSAPVTTSVTILPSPIATFAYRGTNTPTFINGGVAGTFTSTAGLVLNASTGVVNIAASTPGRYIVSNTVVGSGGCSHAIATAEIGITAQHTFAYIWTGAISTEWNIPRNWLPGLVPTDTCDVVIPDANTTPNDPDLPSIPQAGVRTINLESSSILNGGTATTFTVTGNTFAWQSSGLMNPGTSTVKFTNANAQISGSTSFYTVLIPAGAGLTPQPGNLLQVAGALTLQGTLDATANSNTIEYNGTDQTVINPNGSEKGYDNLILSGSGIKSLPATPLMIKGNCLLAGTVTANIYGETTVATDLTVGNESVLNISPKINLTVSGTLTNNNGASGLVLKSDATGTASLIHNTNNVSATVQRYFPGAAEAWHFISPPVSNQNIGGAWLPAGTYNGANGYDLYVWNEPTSCWIFNLNLTTPINWNTVHPATNFEAGRGYLYSLQAANPTNAFTGSLNNGTVTRALTNSSTIDSLKGFNFVGNPYPSAIDWQSSTGWSRSNLLQRGDGYDMWIWNPTANNYGVINSASGLGTNDVTRYIAATQGFFVLASSSGNLQMDNSVRVHDQSDGGFKATKIYRGILNVKVKSTGDHSFDEVMLLFGNKTNNTGTQKLFSNVSTAPSLYLPSSGEKYTVRYLTDTTENPSVPVMFKPGKDGSYTLETNFDFGSFETVTLEDRKVHLFRNLKLQKSYSFQASKTDDPNRFVISFSKAKNEAPQKLLASVYNNGINLIVDLSKVNKETVVNVFDILGRRILQTKLPANSQNNLSINREKQILLITLTNPDGRMNSKVLW